MYNEETTILISKGRYGNTFNDEEIISTIEKELDSSEYVLVTIKPIDKVIYGR